MWVSCCAYLGARVLVADEGEHVVAGDGQPDGGGGAEDDAVGLAAGVGAAVRGHSDAHVRGAGEQRPPLQRRRAQARAEAAHHPLRQLHHAPLPLRRHCQSKRNQEERSHFLIDNSIHRSAASTGAVRGITSGDVVVRHAEGGHGREPLARTLQRGEPAVRPERGAAQHEVAVEDVDREHLLDLHVFDPGHLQHT